MKGILLAAGLGTRLRPVTNTVAKPAISFLNIPLLYYPLALMQTAGLDELVINTHHLPQQIELLASTIPGFTGPVHFSAEPLAPLGSGGGVWQARRWLQDTSDFLLANGDEVLLPSRGDVISKLLERHRATRALATLLVTRHPEVGTKFGGVWTDGNGLVHGFGKKPPEYASPEATPNLTGFHYVGFIALSSRVFDYLPEGESNLLYDALMAAIRDCEIVGVYEDQAQWYETGNIADFLEATHVCLKLLAAHPQGDSALVSASIGLKQMAMRYWPGFAQRPSLWLGNDCQISLAANSSPLTLIGNNVRAMGPVKTIGFAVIGDNSIIGRDCVIENSVILPGSRLTQGTQVKGDLVTPP